MGRVNIAAVALPGPFEVTPATLTFTALDATNFNMTTVSGKLMIIFFNSGAVSRDCIVTSVADERGRTGDKTFALAAGAYKAVTVIGAGWMQSSGADKGKVYYQGAHAEVKVAVIDMD
jgi:hypothetical protein